MGAFANFVAMPFRAIEGLSDSENLLDSPASIRALESHYTMVRARSENNFLLTFKNCLVEGYRSQFNESLNSFRNRDYFFSAFDASGIASDVGAGLIGGMSCLSSGVKQGVSLANIGRISTTLWLKERTYRAPIIFQYDSCRLNCGFPFDSVKVRKPYEKITQKGVQGLDLPGKGANWIKLRGNQGWKNIEQETIWKKDMLHKDHWDVMNNKGIKVKEIDFFGNKIWPDGPKNKNKIPPKTRKKQGDN